MIWAVAVLALVSVAGILYGLLERSKRQAAAKDAGFLAQAVNTSTKRHLDDVARYEALVGLLRTKLIQLQEDLHAGVPAEQLGARISALLRWGVRAPEPPDVRPDSGSVPTTGTPDSGASGG